jgi:hypothetical protein
VRKGGGRLGSARRFGPSAVGIRPLVTGLDFSFGRRRANQLRAEAAALRLEAAVTRRADNAVSELKRAANEGLQESSTPGIYVHVPPLDCLLVLRENDQETHASHAFQTELRPGTIVHLEDRDWVVTEIRAGRTIEVICRPVYERL